MQAELEQIDVSPLDALMKLKGELDLLEMRLQAMEQRKAEVAEAVYLRVRSDYESRRRALEQEAAPLKAAAREQYTRLYALLARSEAAHESSRLDREEIDFRHSLGEFDADEFRRRISVIDEQLDAHAEAHEKALALRQRFVDAFRSEDDLKGGAGGKGSVGARDASSTQPLPQLEEAAVPPSGATQPMAAVDPAPVAAVDDPAVTRAMQVLNGNGGGAARSSQTVMIRSARLVPQNAEAGKLTHMVGIRPFTLGSAEQCDARIPGASAQHAQIKVSMAGFSLTDLGGGVRVNGVAIEQHLLRHEDIVEVGAARFVFRES
jgi:hypothetical protein